MHDFGNDFRGNEKVVDSIPSGSAYFAQIPKQDRHTRDHRDCPACARANQLLTNVDDDFSALRFTEAIEVWKVLRLQKRNLKERTHESVDGFLKALNVFFADFKLKEITAGNIREYQLARQTNRLLLDGSAGACETKPWTRPAGASIINHEISTLAQMLKHAKLWAPLKPYYSPFPIPKWSPREILSEEDEEHLFFIARNSEQVALAYWVACITNNTSAAGTELRGLRLANIFIREPKIGKDGIDRNPSEIYIPADAVKNESRPRKIPLNTMALWAIKQCYQRALRLGACKPEHFLFPFREKRNKYDPARRPSRWWIRDNWKKLRELSGLPDLCPHDLRHQCITRMLENEVDPEIIRSIAGHVTREMMEYYSHVRRHKKYAALMVIEQMRPKAPGSVRTLTRRSGWGA